MNKSFLWRPIVGLPDDTSQLTTGELEALQLIWVEQKEILEKCGVLESFNQRLGREWSIETGIVEGAYNLDRGTTQLLIEHGIDASLIPHEPGARDPIAIAAMVQDHHETLEGLFAFIKGDRPLSVGYIKELHAALLRHQDEFTVVDQFGKLFEKRLEKGSYKKSPNNPTRPDGSIHEYCPPEQVSSEMDRMVNLYRENESKGTPPEVQAAWLHHVFTQIHPFEDGNGRVARALATLVFLKAGWFSLVVTRDDRAKYIEALETADQGDIKPLISQFTQIQQRSLLKAIQIASETHPAGTIDEAVAAVRARLVADGQIMPKEWNQVKVTAEGLVNSALNRLNGVARKLHEEIGSVRPDYKFSAGTGGPRDFLPPSEIAAELEYAPNLTEFHRWVALTLKTANTSKLVISFHGIGPQFRGILAASAFFLTDTDKGHPVVVSDNFFQLNYKETQPVAQKRFSPWLEAAIVKGLDAWRRLL